MKRVATPCILAVPLALSLLAGCHQVSPRREPLPDFKRHSAIEHYNFGTVYERRGQYDKALISYERAIAKDPSYAPAYAGKGNAYLHLGNFTKARVAYEKALALDGRIVQALNNLAWLHTQTEGDLQVAESLAERALEICLESSRCDDLPNETNPVSFQEWRETYRLQELANVCDTLATVRWKKGDAPGARKAWIMALAACPPKDRAFQVGVLLNLSSVAVEMEDLNSALSYLDEAEALTDETDTLERIRAERERIKTLQKRQKEN